MNALKYMALAFALSCGSLSTTYAQDAQNELGLSAQPHLNHQQLGCGFILESIGGEYVPAPPIFDTVQETVTLSGFAPEYFTVPATYHADGTIESPARTQQRIVPPITKTVTRRVIKTPARDVWKPKQYALSNANGQQLGTFSSKAELNRYLDDKIHSDCSNEHLGQSE